MKYDVNLAAGDIASSRSVELVRDGERWIVRVDGELVSVDVTEVSQDIFSVLLNGQSHEIRVVRGPAGRLYLLAGGAEFTAEIADPRAWRGRRQSHMEAEGRQPIVAPMPGKVIRILAGAGERVEAGQGILVVEAMKMQNEVRSPKSGVVERLAVAEGQAVNAGDVLAWVD